MKKVFLGILLATSVFAAGEGLITNGYQNLQQPTNSMADLYTMKQVIISGESGNIVVATKWPGLILKGFYNPRRDSSVYIKCRTQVGDTLPKFSISTESVSMKLPPIDLVFKTGTSDTIYFIFQKR